VIRVFVLDDQDVVRRALAALLDPADDIELVGESASALEATRIIPALRPDVAILDARLGDGSGVAVCRHIRSVDPTIKAVLLTSSQDDEALLDAILAGASGYLLKQIRGIDIADAVRTVADGGSLLDPAVTGRVRERLRARVGARTEELTWLTPPERRVFELMALGRTDRQIGTELSLHETAVQQHVSSVLDKLDVDRRPQAARFASRLLARR